MKKFLQKNSIFDIIRPLAHLSLLALSTMLTVNLFVQFADRDLYKYVWIAFAITVELVKIYSFMLAKQDFVKGYWQAKAMGFVKLIVFIGLATISFLASAGFSLASISEQSNIASVINEADATYDFTGQQIEVLWERYYSYKRDIDEAQKQIIALGDTWITRRDELRVYVDERIKKQDEIMEKLDSLSSQKKNEVKDTKFVALSIFDLLGEEIEWSGDLVMKRMMMALALLLEICTVLTSGTIRKTSILEKRMLEFLDQYLHKDDNNVWKTKELLSVSQELGWPIEECNDYERYLKDTTYQSKPIIEKVDKTLRVNYDKESIIKIMAWKTNSI